MKLTIPFSETILLVKAKCGREITIAAVNEKTVKVEYALQIKIPFTSKYISKEMSIDVTYEKLVGEDLFLSYSGASSLDLIIAGLKKFIPQLGNTELFEFGEGNKAVVHLGKIEKVHDALQKITITDIAFAEEGMNILFGLR